MCDWGSNLVISICSRGNTQLGVDLRPTQGLNSEVPPKYISPWIHSTEVFSNTLKNQLSSRGTTWWLHIRSYNRIKFSPLESQASEQNLWISGTEDVITIHDFMFFHEPECHLRHPGFGVFNVASNVLFTHSQSINSSIANSLILGTLGGPKYVWVTRCSRCIFC